MFGWIARRRSVADYFYVTKGLFAHSRDRHTPSAFTQSGAEAEVLEGAVVQESRDRMKSLAKCCSTSHPRPFVYNARRRYSQKATDVRSTLFCDCFLECHRADGGMLMEGMWP
uniref:Uncharacterized protein n=1 Tax=Steinernema glaseri TaxID=37863 RepID=A0A1I8ANG9_9BILA